MSDPATESAFGCRPGCAACCIAISISSPIPGLPHGKPPGVPCPHLTPDLRCALFGAPARPRICDALTPNAEMCGTDRQHALAYLCELERLTAPSPAAPRPARPA